jgi:hypothetical protein
VPEKISRFELLGEWIDISRAYAQAVFDKSNGAS